METVDIHDESIVKHIHELMRLCGGSPETFEGELIVQLIQTSLKILVDKHDAGQLKLMTRALKEMRYAYRIFKKYPGMKKVSIFGSARTPEDHPDYIAARQFSAAMASQQWMCITGAADGIMKAGLEGAEKESRFGLSIRLPFETPTNSIIAGDPKLISFRYFFTRKLMFLSHSDAVAAFPGGFGTQDELFEVLTLMQTGKANIIPVVLLEGQSGAYWHQWEEYLLRNLLANGWISSQDQHFYYIAPSIEKAVDHICQFYSNYHSSRYVGDCLVIRLKKTLEEQQLVTLNEQFSCLVAASRMIQSEALPEETDHLELPRLIFEHTKKNYGAVRALIDKINAF